MEYEKKNVYAMWQKQQCRQQILRKLRCRASRLSCKKEKRQAEDTAVLLDAFYRDMRGWTGILQLSEAVWNERAADRKQNGCT